MIVWRGTTSDRTLLRWRKNDFDAPKAGSGSGVHSLFLSSVKVGDDDSVFKLVEFSWLTVWLSPLVWKGSI